MNPDLLRSHLDLTDCLNFLCSDWGIIPAARALGFVLLGGVCYTCERSTVVMGGEILMVLLAKSVMFFSSIVSLAFFISTWVIFFVTSMGLFFKKRSWNSEREKTWDGSRVPRWGGLICAH